MEPYLWISNNKINNVWMLSDYKDMDQFYFIISAIGKDSLLNMDLNFYWYWYE